MPVWIKVVLVLILMVVSYYVGKFKGYVRGAYDTQFILRELIYEVRERMSRLLEKLQ